MFVANSLPICLSVMSVQRIELETLHDGSVGKNWLPFDNC